MPLGVHTSAWALPQDPAPWTPAPWTPDVHLLKATGELVAVRNQRPDWIPARAGVKGDQLFPSLGGWSPRGCGIGRAGVRAPRLAEWLCRYPLLPRGPFSSSPVT